jgi:hypothetical protein
MNIRGGRQTSQRNHYKNNAQGQGKRAEIGPPAIDEQAEESRGDRR